MILLQANQSIYTGIAILSYAIGILIAIVTPILWLNSKITKNSADVEYLKGEGVKAAIEIKELKLAHDNINSTLRTEITELRKEISELKTAIVELGTIVKYSLKINKENGSS